MITCDDLCNVGYKDWCSNKCKNNDNYFNCKCITAELWKQLYEFLTNKSPFETGSARSVRGLKYTFDFINFVIENKGGKLLTKKYTSNNKKLDILCLKCNDIWFPIFSNILNGHWCISCAGKKKYSYDFVKKYIKKLNGKLLSKNYISTDNKLEILCLMCNKIWNPTFNNILSGQWCPICSASKNERICNLFFEKLFKNKFIKYKPEWLINSRGNRMELDGFCQELGIAFEHNGEQHYLENNYWKTDLKQRQKDDLLKIELCKKYNIKLIVIPALGSLTKIKDLKQFIIDEANLLNINIIDHNIEINIEEINFKNSIILEEYKYIANSKGGECLSSTYVNNTHKLMWKCLYNHIFFMNCAAIKRGTWCSFCSKRKTYTIEEVIILIENKQGTLLSKKYIGRNSLLKVLCLICNSVWKPTLGSILCGSWCPTCAKNSISERMKFWWANKKLKEQVGKESK